MPKLHHNYYTYITSNPGRTVLYTGVTNNLQVRVRQHMDNRGNPETFAGKFFCYNLVYYEHFQSIEQAIARENMSREKKIELIKTIKPKMHTLKPW